MRALLLHTYESPAKQTWSWSTDTLTTVSGHSQRIAVRTYPTDQMQITLRFAGGPRISLSDDQLTDGTLIARCMADLLACRNDIALPMWHLAERPGEGTRWEVDGLQLRMYWHDRDGSFFSILDGDQALLKIGSRWHLATCQTSYQGDYCLLSLHEPSDALASSVEQCVPIRTAYLDDGQQVALGRASDTADVTLTLHLWQGERQRLANRQPPDLLRDVMISGALYSILDMRAEQGSLDLTLTHGEQRVTTPSGLPYREIYWSEPKVRMSVSVTVQNWQAPDCTGRRPIEYYRQFFDAARGGQRAFFFPTLRRDFAVKEQISQTALKFDGPGYSELWRKSALKALAFETSWGIEVRQVVFCGIQNGDAVAELETPLIGEDVLAASLCPFVRIVSDSVTWTHRGLDSRLELDLETVNFDNWRSRETPTPFSSIRCDDAQIVLVGDPVRVASIPDRGRRGLAFSAPVGSRPYYSAPWADEKMSANFTSPSYLDCESDGSEFSFLTHNQRSFHLFARVRHERPKGPFSPAQIPDIFCWFRGDRGADIVNGKYVSVVDQAAPEYVFAQSNVGYRADASTWAGKSVPVFDTGANGSSRSLLQSNRPASDWEFLSNGESWTAIVRMRNDYVNVGAQYLLTIGNWAQSGLWISTNNQQGGRWIIALRRDGNYLYNGNQIGPIIGGQVSTLIIRSDGGAVTCSVNGIPFTTTGFYEPGAAQYTQPIVIGSTGGNPIPEVIFYKRALDNSELSQLTTYLETEWPETSPIFSMMGNDPDAVIEDDKFVSIPDRGNVPGAVVAQSVVARRPEVVQWGGDGEPCPRFTASNSALGSDRDANDFACLTDGKDDVLITYRYLLEETPVDLIGFFHTSPNNQSAGAAMYAYTSGGILRSEYFRTRGSEINDYSSGRPSIAPVSAHTMQIHVTRDYISFYFDAVFIRSLTRYDPRYDFAALPLQIGLYPASSSLRNPLAAFRIDPGPVSTEMMRSIREEIESVYPDPEES